MWIHHFFLFFRQLQEAPFNCVKYVRRMTKIFALSHVDICYARHVSRHGKLIRRVRYVVDMWRMNEYKFRWEMNGVAYRLHWIFYIQPFNLSSIFVTYSFLFFSFSLFTQQGCPFCRAEIKGTEQIVVDAFDPQRQYNRISKQKEEDHDDENEVL